MAERKKENAYRFRLSVPPADTQVLDWIFAQENLSFSLRTLIRETVAKRGITDFVNAPVEPGVSPGRPKKGLQRSDKGSLSASVPEEISEVIRTGGSAAAGKSAPPPALSEVLEYGEQALQTAKEVPEIVEETQWSLSEPAPELLQGSASVIPMVPDSTGYDEKGPNPDDFF